MNEEPEPKPLTDKDRETIKFNIAFHIREAAVLMKALYGGDVEVERCDACKGTGVVRKAKSNLILPN